MMKIIKYVFNLCLVALIVISCVEDDNTDYVDAIAAPANVSAKISVTQDNTGLVTITPLAEGAVSYNVSFGDGSEIEEGITPGNGVDHIYEEGTYEATITAVGLNGLTTAATQNVVVSFKAPENLMVTIENDAAISKQVNVSATADFVTSFEVYFGEVGKTDPVVMNIDETISYLYEEAGTYTIRVVAMSAAIETVEYSEEFIVTAILQPLTAAPTPNRAQSDVISIYSDSYVNPDPIDYYPNWGQTTTYTQIEVAGNSVIQYGDLTYQGIDFNTVAVDASAMEFIHIDVWTADANFNAKLSPISSGPNEAAYDLALIQDQWTSFDIPISFFTDANPALNFGDIIQFKFDGVPSGGGTIFVDNLYFYKPGTTAPVNLLTNGDFENGSDSWLIGVDDNSSAPVTTEGDNTFYSVNVASAGNPFDVNVSQKVEITQGETYTLTFDAWSDGNRSILAGIGLSADPWTNTTENVNITTTPTTYSYTFTATDFGAANARVIFDLGAEVGIVNIDNVILSGGEGVVVNLLANPDFENGSDSWLIGVDDNSSAPVVTEGDNTYYSVNVASAGNPFDVNLSQKVEIIQGETYTLTFDAWSDVNRLIIAGIGLSADPWTNTTENVSITTTRATYSYSFTATEFGDANARVIFDLGAEVGMVNIDDVSLVLE
ncbi:carbohydrate binding domain-containing protein [Algibacter sp. AS12]|uniref:carbohydrate binding domain-containing protein n=1 Tax=Algibacter sp. AS12 TaxID=3135773 RepID=UPI00398B1CF0